LPRWANNALQLNFNDDLIAGLTGYLPWPPPAKVAAFLLDLHPYMVAIL
jgi:hypothetical protein